MVPAHLTPTFLALIAERIDEVYDLQLDLTSDEVRRECVRDWLIDVLAVDAERADSFSRGEDLDLNDTSIEHLCHILHLDHTIVSALRHPTSDEILRHTLLSVIEEAEPELGADEAYASSLATQIRSSLEREQLERAAIVILGQYDHDYQGNEVVFAESTYELLAIYEGLSPAAQTRIRAAALDEASRAGQALAPALIPALSRWRDEYLTAIARRVLDELVAADGGQLDTHQLAQRAGLANASRMEAVVASFASAHRLFNADSDLHLPNAPVLCDQRSQGLLILRLHPECAHALRALAAAQQPIQPPSPSDPPH